jgi:hypothetical protein
VDAGPLGPFVRARRAGLDALRTCRVVVAAPIWNRHSTNDCSASLVRGLRARGIDAHLLLTEETLEIHRQTPRVPLPPDVPCRHLAPAGGWIDRWAAMVDYLESRAPCIYLPNLDIRHSCVTPLLSDRVMVVGEVHESSFSYNQAGRLAQYWNAIVVHDDHDAGVVRRIDDTLASRLHVIPRGHELVDELSHRSPADGPLRVVCQGRCMTAAEIQPVRLLLDRLRDADGHVEMTVLVQGESTLPLEAGLGPGHHAAIVHRFDALSFDQTRDLYDRAHVLLGLSSEFDGDWQGLVEAMGRGCVPILWRRDPASDFGKKLVTPDNGYDLTGADPSEVVDALTRLHRDRGLYQRLRVNASNVAMGCYGTDDVVEDYLELFGAVFDEQRTGAFRRPAGPLALPPDIIDGVKVFEQASLTRRPPVGAYPRLFGAARPGAPRPPTGPGHAVSGRGGIGDMAAQLAAGEALRSVNVIVGLPVWTGSYTDRFCARLVRLLRDRGVPAHVLLTEEDTTLVAHPDVDVNDRAEHADVCERLPVDRLDGWGAHWGAMVRYLEEHAPCIYIPNHDWRHSGVVPLLSDQVMVVGVVYANDALQRDHVRRLGRFWNALVVCHGEMEQTVEALDASLVPRVTFIETDDVRVADRYEDLFYRVFEQVQRSEFERPREPLQVPPREIDGAPVFWERLTCRRPGIGSFPQLRDYRAFEQEVRALSSTRLAPLVDRLGPDSAQSRHHATRLEAVEVVVALPSWTGGGVDELSLRLVRGLRQRGLRAHILLTEEDTALVSRPGARAPRPDADGGEELFAHLPVEREASWGAHWGAMVRYLEERAPCIYVPNHDWRHSCVAPLLSDRIVVVGLLHGDDPFHCDHLRRLGRYWNAIVALTHDLADTALAWDASASPRLHVIEPDGPDMVEEYLDLFHGTIDAVERGAFRRPRGPLRPPPAEVGGHSVFPVTLTHIEPEMGAFPAAVPDYADFVESIGEARRRALKLSARAVPAAT